MTVQHLLDLPSKIGGNIIAGLFKPQLDHASRMLSIARGGGWINSNCGQCLERIEGALPGQRLEIFVIHYTVPSSDRQSVSSADCDDSHGEWPPTILRLPGLVMSY